MESSSQLRPMFAEESAQLDTHSKTHFVFLTACQDSETTDSVVVLNKESSLDARSLTSSSKALASQPAAQEPSPTPTPESVKPALPTVSHACHLLSVQTATQVSISETTSVSLVKDVPTTDSNTTVFASMLAQSVLSFPTDIVKEDVIPTLSSGTTDATASAHHPLNSELTLPVFHNAQLDTFLTEEYASFQSKPAHLDNSTTPKLELVLLVLSHAQNVNSPTHSVPLAQPVTHSTPTDALKQPDVDQEDSELLQDHAQPAQPNVLTALAPLNASPVLQAMFSTESTVF